MILRRPTVNEFMILRKMHEPLKDQFKFPDFGLLSSIYVVVDGEEIIGFGAMQPIFEAVIILNQEKSINERIDALTMLENIAESELKDKNIDQIHAFVQDNKFANFIKNRLGYKETKGKSYVKQIN